MDINFSTDDFTMDPLSKHIQNIQEFSVWMENLKNATGAAAKKLEESGNNEKASKNWDIERQCRKILLEVEDLKGKILDMQGIIGRK